LQHPLHSFWRVAGQLSEAFFRHSSLGVRLALRRRETKKKKARRALRLLLRLDVLSLSATLDTKQLSAP